MKLKNRTLLERLAGRLDCLDSENGTIETTI